MAEGRFALESGGGDGALITLIGLMYVVGSGKGWSVLSVVSYLHYVLLRVFH